MLLLRVLFGLWEPLTGCCLGGREAHLENGSQTRILFLKLKSFSKI